MAAIENPAVALAEVNLLIAMADGTADAVEDGGLALLAQFANGVGLYQADPDLAQRLAARVEWLVAEGDADRLSEARAARGVNYAKAASVGRQALALAEDEG